MLRRRLRGAKSFERSQEWNLQNHQNLPVTPSAWRPGVRKQSMERAVARCSVCKLNQYVPANGCCRRCNAPLNQITKPEVGTSVSELFASHKVDLLSSSLESQQKDRSRWAAALALVLVKERKRRNLSQSEVSQSAGLPRTYISRIETGRLGLSFATLAQYARALGLSVSEVVTRAESIIATNGPAQVRV